jgi:hypothetical protein
MLASFLAYRDQPYELVRGEGGIASWVFDNGAVSAMVDAFEDMVASVEPQRFFHTITKTRRTMFDFINGSDQSWDEQTIKDHKPSR